MSPSPSRKPIEIKISTVVAISAILHASNPSQLEMALKEMTGGMPDFFDHEFAVIDLGALDIQAADIDSLNCIDWPALIKLFKAYKLNPVAVRNAPTEMEAVILAHGLSLDATAKTHHVSVEAESPATAVLPPAGAAVSPPAMIAKEAATPSSVIIDTPVRAGQRIYARDADLIITAAVNNGAEVIADGSIHVYAPLRGRALAGASGNTGARIFAMNMEAELISIAGIYRTFEDGFPRQLARQAIQVCLVGDRIDIHPIHL